MLNPMGTMKNLKTILRRKIPGWRKQVQEILSAYPDVVISQVTVQQLFKGLRNVPAVLCDTSFVDPQEGLIIRGVPVLELIDRSAEEIFFLLTSGEFPTPEALHSLQTDLINRREVPLYVWQLLESVPPDTHPMVMFSMAMLALQKESVFTNEYRKGLPREAYWEATYEDALNIIARLPVIAAGIYRQHILGKDRLFSRPDLHTVANFAHLLGNTDPQFVDFMEKFFVVHSDHEGANASVFTSRVVNSSLSDLYYAISASMNSLAGPLHGLANQESLSFVMHIYHHFRKVPKPEDLEAYIREHLQSGKVIPGFGHAVLRNHDPRYLALHELGSRICSDDPLFQIVSQLQTIVPRLLKEQGKANNPYPNIDGITGALLYHFGIKEKSFYTVLFSTAQVLGICAQLIINQALMMPIFRPRSITTEQLQQLVEPQKEGK